MEVVRAVIYMGFGPLSCATRSRSCIFLQSNFKSLFVGTRSGLREEHGDGEFCFCFFVLESCEEGDAGPGLLLG
jgi:hypothetical protein